MKIRYNAPVTLTFALFSSLILAIDQFTGAGIVSKYFAAPPNFDPGNPLHYILLVTHIAGHADWAHLLGNFAFILLLGPILEEKHGSRALLGMMVITAVVTGLVNALFLNTGLLGASGIVFMMILLASFTNIGNGEIPLTFIMVVLLYLARELINSIRLDDGISQLAHIVGGLCGSLFGFLRPRRR